MRQPRKLSNALKTTKKAKNLRILSETPLTSSQTEAAKFPTDFEHETFEKLNLEP